jgi:glycosyltransferase involved in cell wall biosynthesis
MTPRVSIVIPAYNNDEYIGETMRSVLSQTYTDFELIVADHSSTDRTWEVLEEFASDPRVRLLTTPAGGGAERNWNRVTNEAAGELVKLVCGDDILYPESLSTQVAAFDANPGAVMVASPRDIVDASGRPIVRNQGLAGMTGRVKGTDAVRRSVLRGANVFGEPCCVMLRRDVLERVGGWHGDPGFMIDQGTYSRVLFEGDFVGTAGPLAAFRVSASQWSVRLTRQQAESAADMHQQLADLSPETLSPADVRRGNRMARLRAWQRRLAYLYLGRRMRPQA